MNLIDKCKNPILRKTSKKMYIINQYLGSQFDPATIAFMEAAVIPNDTTVYFSGTAYEITGAALWTALDTFVKKLKADGVWELFYAIYPMIGGTSTTHKFNLIDPQDTDGAYRLTFNGTITHDGGGMAGNGTDGYYAPHFNTLADYGTADDASIWAYIRSNIASASRTEFGTEVAYRVYFNPRNASNQISSDMFGVDSASYFISNSDSRGLFGLTRGSSTTYTLYKNKTGTDVTENSNLTNSNIYGMKNGTNYSSRQHSFSAIGKHLDVTQQGNFYDAIQALQTSLFRNV